jgi:peptide/nickel transport system permease protein
MSSRKRNLPLIIGTLIVALVALLALLGPVLAPRDPLERTLVTEIGGRVRGVPFPPFQSWSFPLGSDRFGRDLFSRLLWAVRPTLLLVLIVAALRLTLGVLIGALAGWARGWPGRALNGLIDAALSIPVLVVALAALAVVGVERGLPAFIAALALTGWAETAQVVRTTTRRIAAQTYISAAQALGAGGAQILLRHIGRHLAPLLAILFAFEASGTLMLTAALGFLGYFIGGGVWIIAAGEAIPEAVRVAGLPELGQLVGTAPLGVSTRPPWEMIFPGLVIVLAILGFSLLGEGLRRRQERLAPRRTAFGAVLAELEEAVVAEAGRWEGRLRVPGYALVGVLLLGGGLIWWQARPGPLEPAMAGTALARPEGWPAERGDQFGSLAGAVPELAPSLRWNFSAPAGMSGGPAVAADGTLYLAGLDSTLYALDRDGQSRWTAPLAALPVGGPALSGDGTIYVSDQAGGLSAYAATGERRWRFLNSYRSTASSGPIVGSDGTIYYAVLDAVQAVNPDGQARWLARDPDLPYFELQPRLSPDERLVFLKSSAFRSDDGARLLLKIRPDEPVYADPLMVVGADGRNYYRSEHRLIPWELIDGGLAVQPTLGWAAASALFMPSDTGVTARGLVWVIYASERFDTRLLWLEPGGGRAGEAFFALRNGRVFAADADGRLLLCGTTQTRALQCGAYSPAAGDTALWTLELGASGAQASGVALADGRIYVATRGGELFALE